MPIKTRPEIGQLVTFRTKTGDKLRGEIIKISGDVYTVKLSDGTRPVHHKYLETINSNWPKKEKIGEPGYVDS